MLARIVRFIHEQGSAAGMQLAHAGRKGSTQRPWDGHGAVAARGGRLEAGRRRPREPFAETYPVPRALDDRTTFQASSTRFADAARRALAAGLRRARGRTPRTAT